MLSTPLKIVPRTIINKERHKRKEDITRKLHNMVCTIACNSEKLLSCIVGTLNSR